MYLVYTLTAAGQEALSSEVGEGDFPLEVNFPQDYRRLLAMIEVGGHEEVIRGRLRRFPDQLINEWLKELEDLKMVESREAGELDAVTFTGARLPLLPPLTDEDRKRLAKTTVLGSATLLRSGSFLAADRIANLPPHRQVAGRHRDPAGGGRPRPAGARRAAADHGGLPGAQRR